MFKRILFFLCLAIIFAAVSVRAEPVERSGVSVSSGWTGLPSFVKSAVKSTDTTMNMEGYSLAVGYVSYGSKGPKSVFSSRYTFTYNHYRSLPNAQGFTAQNADMFIFDVAEILTIFPSLPVNLYTGIGTGWGIVHVYHWGAPAPDVDPNSVKNTKDAVGKFPLPLPIIYIPVGINIRIKNLIFSAEAGIRDIPYLIGMFTYAFGKEDNVRIVQLPPPPPDTGTVTGNVIDRDTKEPLGRAVVEMVNTGMTDLSTNPVSGAFTTPGLKAGIVKLLAYKDGYISNSVTATVLAGKTVSTTIALQRESLIGAVYGIVTDLQGRPLSASISASPVPGSGITAQTVRQAASNPVTGEFFLKLPAGSYAVSASLQSYKTQAKEVVVHKGFKTGIRFTMEPEQLAPPFAPAPTPPVIVQKQKIFIEKEKKRIVITEKIFFKLGKAVIMPVSFGILDELAGVLIKNPNIKIRIEGHTDNTGSPAVNMRLSQARADAVMKYLAGKGVADDRMTAKGYGMTMPVADNRTAAGRAENRRVEFVITAQ